MVHLRGSATELCIQTVLTSSAKVMLNCNTGEEEAASMEYWVGEFVLQDERVGLEDRDRADGVAKCVLDAEGVSALEADGVVADFPFFGFDTVRKTNDRSFRLQSLEGWKLELTWRGTAFVAGKIALCSSATMSLM